MIVCWVTLTLQRFRWREMGNLAFEVDWKRMKFFNLERVNGKLE